MSVKPFSAGQTLESLRDSDFDSCSALGEVIDNSEQANAKSVRVHFSTPSNNTTINDVVFIDDGDGMSKETLQYCLRLGWSSRYNDRSGIGRFGVGMTLGAIHECRRVEVYSLAKNSEWYFTYLDLDEIEESDLEKKDWEIPTPKKKVPSLEGSLSRHLPTDSGTVVIWSKYDRLDGKASVLIEQFRIWLGRTYRYFIWNESVVSNVALRAHPLSIYLNGKEIMAIDPLYLRTDKTEFPDDPKAVEDTPIIFDWVIKDSKLVEKLGAEMSQIRIRLTLLPKVWREYQGQGGKTDAKKRQIHDNEGFSIVRHGREVGYDWIPHFRFKSDDKDRFWGCEIHFEPCLDRSFQVKNIKRGAVPSNELKQTIADLVGPWIKKQRETISEDWRVQPQGQEQSGGHGLSEQIAKLVQPLGPKAKVPNAKIVDAAGKLSGQNDPEEVARWIAKFSSQPFTIGERSWPDSSFIDIHSMGGSDALFYNSSHIFLQVLDNIKKHIKGGTELASNADRVTVLIDMLLISYAKAESMLMSTAFTTQQDLIDRLKTNWSLYLKTYVATWRAETDNGI